MSRRWTLMPCWAYQAKARLRKAVAEPWRSSGRDLDIGQARGVIDSDVDKVPADAPVAVLSLSRDAMASTLDTPEFLDIQMQELARVLLLVAPRRLGRLERLEP